VVESDTLKLLGDIVDTGAKPVAILSLLVNLYLWRSFQARQQRVEELLLQARDTAREELEKTKEDNSQLLRETARLAALFRDERQPERPRRSAPRDVDR